MNNIRYKIANFDEIKAARRFIYEKYCNVGYLKKNSSHSIFSDEYIAMSTYIIALHDNKIIGTLRIIKPSDKGFPMLKILDKNINLLVHNKSVEIGNLTAVPGHAIAKDLFYYAYRYSREKGFLYWLAAIDNGYYQKIKNWFKFVRIKELGKPQFYLGSYSVPILINTKSFGFKITMKILFILNFFTKDRKYCYE